MTSRVTLSKWSMILTTLITSFLIAMTVIMFIREDNIFAWSFLACDVLLYSATLFYTPVKVYLDDKRLIVCRSMRNRVIKLSEIESIRLCPPTMAARRICGSSGLGGYWGWFSERDIGRYFAYYGKASECFIVKLRSGRQYMIGCNDAAKIVGTITRSI